MHKQFFCLSIALLASLQLSASSSSSNNSTLDNVKHEQLQNKLILDFLNKSCVSKEVNTLLSDKKINMLHNFTTQLQKQCIAPLKELLKPCDQKDEPKHLAQYFFDIQLIILKIQSSQCISKSSKAERFILKNYAKMLYSKETLCDLIKEISCDTSNMREAYASYNEQMNKNNLQLDLLSAHKTIQKYNTQRLTEINKELAQHFEFQQAFIQMSREKIDDMAKDDPELTQKIAEYKKHSDCFKDDSASSSDSSSSDTDGYY